MFSSTDSSKGDTMDISSEMPVSRTTCPTNSENLCTSKSNFFSGSDSSNISAKQNDHNINLINPMQISGKPSFSFFGKSPSFSFAGTAAKAAESPCSYQDMVLKTPTIFPQTSKSDITSVTVKSLNTSGILTNPTHAFPEKSTSLPFPSSTVKDITSKKYLGEHFFSSEFEQKMTAKESPFPFEIVQNKDLSNEQNVEKCFTSLRRYQVSNEKAKSFSETLMKKEPIPNIQEASFGSCKDYLEKKKQFSFTDALEGKATAGIASNSCKGSNSVFFPYTSETQKLDKDGSPSAINLSAKTVTNILTGPTKPVHSAVEKGNSFSFVAALGNQVTIADNTFPQPDKNHETKLQSVKADLSKVESSSFPSIKEEEAVLPKHYVSKPTLKASGAKERNDESSSSFIPQVPTKSDGMKLYDASKIRKYGDSLARRKVFEDVMSAKKSQKIKRLLSSEEIREKTSIVCKEIQSDINDKEILSNHFSQFGDVQRVTCNKEKKYAIVRFKTHEAASMAKLKGSLVLPFSKPVDIFWLRKSTKSVEEKNTSVISEIDQELRSMMEVEVPCVLNRPLEKAVISSSLNVTAKQKHNKRDNKPLDSGIIPKISKLPDPSEESLRKFLENTAQTPGEKYRILDARDKLMRLRLLKHSDISTAKAVIGRCPDMCSEKERYSRFEKNRLSVFELKKTFDPKVTVKNLDHMLIIKEYSRSSADQEEPLPHEIRPPQVLMLTMDYIMCNIANMSEDCAVSVGEWYDFIWNRTRAIRKDITQQDLCNVYCVELVEKCARFHIHCAAVLCEEDMATFDPKINDENLTKSLQTLKHLYHDLAIKGTRCPNEEEFRAYDILLSLNEGDALRHAQTLSESIRNSHEVKFAVSAALSLNSNNYVRFFKLVQKAPYLMSCIMHRYFTQVRSKAIKALLKAYCLPNHIEQYPLQDLVSFLKFGDVSEASHFCQWLGFQTNDNYVFLDRGSFAMPASSTLVTRAVTLVECKRKGSVAEVMNNGRLPTNPLEFYKPHTSFDDQGNLKKEAINACDQASKIVLYERAEECLKEHGLQTSKGSGTETAVKHDSQEHIVGKCDSNFHKFPPVSVSYQEQKLMDSSTTVETGKCPANVFDTSGRKDNSSILCRALSGDFNIPRILPLPSNEMQKISMSQFPMNSDKYVFSSSSLGLNNEEMMHFANEVQQNLLSEVLTDFIKEIISKEIFLTKSANKLYETYLSFALEDELRIICAEVMNCEVMKMAENKKRVYETQKKREKAANDIKHDLINDVIEEIIQSITRSIHGESRAKAINCVSRSVAESFLEDSVQESLTLIAKEIYDKEMNAWEHHIHTARRKTELLRARKFLVRWERACIARRKLEACRNTFPSNPVFAPIGKLSGSNAFKNFHSVIQSKNKVAKMLDAAVFYNIIKEELSWHPLDLCQVFENCFGKKYPSLPCWKLLLILPVKENDADWTVIASWLCTKFEKGYKMPDFDPGTKLCSLYLLPCSTGDPIPICVRAFFIGTDDFSKNLEVIRKTGFLEGASAVLLLMPNCEKDFVFQEKVYEHLQQLLAIKSPIPSMPLYCFLTSPKILGDLGNENKLNHIMNEGYIDDYKIYHLDISSGFLKAEEELQEAVEWLLCRQLPIPDVSHTYLKDFVEDCLIQVFNIVYHDMAQQQEQRKFQNPSIIVQFYNTVVKHWIKTASSAELRNISWPPPEITKGVLNAVDLEFGWNSEGHLNKIKNILSRFILPEFPCMPVTLEELCSYIEEVTKMHFKNTCSLYSSIADILENEQDVNGEKENFHVLWAKIIWECIRYLISCETFLDETTDREFEVNYILEDLQTFDYDDTWKTLTREDKVGSKKRKNSINSHVDLQEHKIFKLHSTPQFCEMSAGRLPASAEIFHFMGSSEKPLFETQSSMTLKETKHFQIEHNIVKLEASSKSMNNFQAEHLSLELSRAVECEKFESEAYFSALAFSVNNGQFQEEEFDIGPKEECSMDTYNAISSSSQCFGTSKLLHKADLQDRIDALNESIEAQHKANNLFDKRIQALTFSEF